MNTIKSTLYHIIKRKESPLFLVLFITGIGLFGWLSGKMSLTSFSLKYIPIPHSEIVVFIALCFLLIINNNFKKSQLTKSFVTLSAIIIAFYCSLIFLDFLFNFTWDAENIFIKNPAKFGTVLIGRMSPITALMFICTCIGVLGTCQNNSNKIKYIGGSFSLIVSLISSVLLIGYLYKAPILYGSQIIPVSLPAAICFLLFSITLLRGYESRFLTFNLMKENKVARLLLKSFLPIVVLIVILEGFLDTTFSLKENNPPLTAAIILLIVVAITIYIVFRVSGNIGDELLSAEKSLQESERRYRFIFEKVGEGIGFINPAEEFLLANPAAERIFGMGEGELHGKNLREFLSEEQYLSILNQTKIREDGKGSTYEFEFTRSDGKKRSAIITAVPQFDSNELFRGTHSIFRDITEQKLAEQKLRESEKQLRQLNVDKDRFISILGHDLKNPFNNILGFSEILNDEIESLNKDEIKDIAKNINKSAKITNKLLEDILMWARTQNGNIPFKPQKLRFADITNTILEILNPSAYAKNITIYSLP